MVIDFTYAILEKTRERGLLWFLKRVLHIIIIIPLYLIYSALILIPGYPVCKLFNLRFLNVVVRAIGHLCVDVDCYLKEGLLGLRPEYKAILLASKKNVANAHLLTYWEKYLKIIRSPLACLLLRPLAESRHTQYYTHRYSSTIDSKADVYDIQGKYGTRPPLLALSDSDRNRGRALLNDLGVPPDAWFVCVHAREDGYSPNSGQSYRNSDINNFLLAMDAIVKRGGWIIRVGDPTMVPLPKMDRVIDYVHLTVKSDWMDIFLVASCKFFFGSASGLSGLAYVFGTPCVTVDNAPLACVLPVGPNDISIPKLVWSNDMERYLSFREIFSTPVSNYRYGAFFERANLRVVNNTSEEIQAAAIEMLDKVNGKAAYTEHDEELQTRFKSLMNPTHYSYGSLSRIGRDFMRKYSHMLE